jgi:hypothetical protein
MANEPQQWLQVSGADHNDVPESGGDALFETSAQFIQRHAKAS